MASAKPKPDFDREWPVPLGCARKNSTIFRRCAAPHQGQKRYLASIALPHAAQPLMASRYSRASAFAIETSAAPSTRISTASTSPLIQSPWRSTSSDCASGTVSTIRSVSSSP
jgi:hypothetical protein